MSWRGVKKSISRLPHQFKTRNGGGDDVTRDKEYLALEAEYKDFIKSSEQLFSETVAYRDSLAGILEHQLQCANYLTEIYSVPDESSEYKDLPATTKQALEDYATAMTYCREETMALLDELDVRVVRPFDQYHLLVKAIEKTMMKRQHKLIDFDRHRVSYIKFSAITEPSPSEERNMLKLQAQYENASHDYDYFNDMLKNDLITFLELSSEFIQPILGNFFDLQYRIIGGFYGRIYEVIQHNQSFLPTLDMPIDEGFIFRLSQVNAGEEIENSDLVKKGLKSWERTTTSRSNTSKSLSYGRTLQQDNGDHLSIQGHPAMNRTISNQSSNSSLYNNRERPSYVSSTSESQTNMSSTSYQSNNNEQRQTLPYTPTPPPLLPKPSLSPAVSYYAKSATASPPPLAKKPILAPRPSFTNKAQNVNNTPPPIRRPSGSPVTSSSFENFDKAKSIIQNHQQGKSPSVSDTKFGYQASKNLSSSSLNKSSIMTPPPIAELNNPFSKKSSPPPLSSSPFADQQQEVIKKKRSPPPPPPSRGSYKKEYVEALYDLNATQDGDLSFAFGDRIEVIEKSDKSDDWWKGRIGTQVGMFPANYVRQI